MPEYVDINGAMIEKRFFDENVEEAKSYFWEASKLRDDETHAHCMICGIAITNATKEMKYKSKGGKIRFDELKPITGFKLPFHCRPNKDTLVITPDGFMYSCVTHIPWSRKSYELNTVNRFKNLCLGKLGQTSFNDVLKSIESNKSYKWLCGQYSKRASHNECKNCEYILQCKVCPATSMIYSKEPTQIPHWICEIKKGLYKIGRDYWKSSDREVPL